MDKLNMQTKNLAEEKFKQLQQLFPNAVTETTNEEGNVVKAIDKDILMQEISSEVVEGPKERYQFTWPDKKKAVHAAGAPTSNTLRPCREESVNFDETENLYIEGDNLEVLKLLQETYLNKIDLIYIDPPYNTGENFVYNDSYEINYGDYLQKSGQFDEEGNRLGMNTERNGRFHTDWLNMMYPRLILARNLLSEKGVIFISIDDNEQANLKKICDETFGANNFVNNISVKMSESKGVKNTHAHSKFPKMKEHILIYSKNTEQFSMNPIRIKKSENELEGYTKYYNKQIDNLDDDIQNWVFSKYRGGNKIQDAEKLIYLVVPDNDVNINLEEGKFKKITNSNENDVYYYNDGGDIKKVLFLSEYLDKNESDLWVDISTININKENYNLPTLENGQKPLKLLKKIIKVKNKDALILDFFSGSSTTAHAILDQNKLDNGSRRFIMVQLPEVLEESLKKATGKTKKSIKELIEFLNSINKPTKLTELGKERIRRAGNQILKDHNDKDGMENLDIGFRVLKTDSSNMKDVYYSPSETQQDLLDMLEDNIKEDRSAEDLLFQVMLDLGISLSSKIKVETIDDTQVYIIEDGFLIACFDKNIDEKVVEKIAKRTPYYAIFRDSSITNDSVAANFEQTFESISPETVRKVL
ncbi:site-specific DNA-methyltransferase [Dolosigranulum pigrum]|uniref:site-specific DNA-methyltransferase n=1 Tax=Dolosigranulum pigrum TaxID=29394 RepID=UPI001AD87D7D|nr:site-specific DNA-methyltransferase [Dolosigranulum pigrum]QTJ58371.1 site-specific DNA-methyltransferase [Dolosigranulum pigrum]